MILRWFRVVALGTLLVAFLGYFDSPIWWLELPSHFQFQCFLLSLCLSLLFAYRKARNSLIVSTAAFLLSGIHLLPFYVGTQSVYSETEIAHEPLITRILSANVYTQNPDPEAFIEMVKHYKPDVLSVQELSPKWHMQLKKLRGYVPVVTQPAENNFGIGVYVKKGTQAAGRIRELSADFPPAIQVQLQDGPNSLLFYSVHVVPPVNDSLFVMRNTMSDLLAAEIRSSTIPRIACGDFNASPWTGLYRRFIAIAGLEDTQLGQGVKRTWIGMGSIFALPIDFCFASEDVRVHRHEMLDVAGSDHRALLIEVSI